MFFRCLGWQMRAKKWEIFENLEALEPENEGEVRGAGSVSNFAEDS